MYLWNKQSPGNLGFYRPNQAMNRVYAGYPGLSGLGAPPVLSIAQMQRVLPLSGLGADVAVDSNLLLPGIGLLAGAMFLFGMKKGPRLRQRKADRLRRKLKALEA